MLQWVITACPWGDVCACNWCRLNLLLLQLWLNLSVNTKMINLRAVLGHYWHWSSKIGWVCYVGERGRTVLLTVGNELKERRMLVGKPLLPRVFCCHRPSSHLVLLSNIENVFEQVELFESETGKCQDWNGETDLGKANQRSGTGNRGN